eukprot:TRINITY_DN1581_c0_g1_i1.p1 TRINITY_DN1581_c0_g1~~TRINITY_DN1581_c0_g1_i1.p1  ORF type:complete len:512 (-),score=68.44 TRINITY_DN1581_c0_g1_i1:120-1655(-)
MSERTPLIHQQQDAPVRYVPDESPARRRRVHAGGRESSLSRGSPRTRGTHQDYNAEDEEFEPLTDSEFEMEVPPDHNAYRGSHHPAHAPHDGDNSLAHSHHHNSNTQHTSPSHIRRSRDSTPYASSQVPRGLSPVLPPMHKVTSDDSYSSDDSSSSPRFTKPVDPDQNRAEVREGIRTGALFMCGLVAVGVIMVQLRFLLVPLVLSRFLVYLFQPLVMLLIGAEKWPFIRRRLRLPRALAVLIVFSLIICVVALLCLAIFLSVKQIVSHKDTYAAELDRWLDMIVALAKKLGYEDADINDLMPDINWESYAINVIGILSDLVPELVVVVLFVVYMLLDFNANATRSELRRNIDNKVRKYILVHSLIALVTGFLTWLILFVLGIPLSIFFGLMAFLLEYVPNIGAVIAVVMPLPLVLLSPHVGWVTIVLTFLLPAGLHFLLGQVMEPRILGHVLEMPALTVLAGLMFWGYLWGIIGAVLSVPLTASIHLWLESVDHPMTQFFAHLLHNLACD